MLYDKYQNYPLPARSGNVFSVMQGRGIEQRVLQDLIVAKDDIEKLEILDSFAAYAKRAYRQEFAEVAALITGQQLGSLLEPLFLSRLPEVRPLGRPRAVRKMNEKEGD